VRVSYANIPAPVSKPPQTPPSATAEPSITRRQAIPPADRYEQNPRAQVIDAEFVEFYSPSVTPFAQELHHLEATFDPGVEENKPAGQNESPQASASEKYQPAVYEAPPPGTFLDTYA
jgi:hypothetical protein